MTEEEKKALEEQKKKEQEEKNKKEQEEKNKKELTLKQELEEVKNKNDVLKTAIELQKERKILKDLEKEYMENKAEIDNSIEKTPEKTADKPKNFKIW